MMKYLRTRADQTRGGEVPWGPGPPYHKERKHVLTQYTLQRGGGRGDINTKGRDFNEHPKVRNKISTTRNSLYYNLKKKLIRHSLLQKMFNSSCNSLPCLF